MSIKLSTYKTEEKKVLEEQYEFNVVDDINIGLLHQVSKALLMLHSFLKK